MKSIHTRLIYIIGVLIDVIQNLIHVTHTKHWKAGVIIHKSCYLFPDQSCLTVVWVTVEQITPNF
jgi:hypothetical protein